MIGRENIHIDELDKILYERLLWIEENDVTLDKEIKKGLTEYIEDNDRFSHIRMIPFELFIDKKIEDHNFTHQYYSVPLKYEKGAKEELKRLLKNDIIEETRIPYASPSFLIEKKNKELRFVVDHRKVNEFIKDEISMIPKIFENLYKLERKKIFSKIDLKMVLIK
ncbi:Transposon Tf2-11 polyprotein [Nosema granulosis]|uniref:Transposon Tf2-11 polyprotein n=1 Tax=Nosema granulosis TaxID=83296 RepID=A0A9P6GVR8_9MICR|nr:Transposon Tf2-11 polyprotein [Nosema granulosis]